MKMKTSMEVLGVLATIGLVTMIAPLAAAFGAMAGWFVSLFYDDTAREVLTAIGGKELGAVALWKLGAVLGFVSVFFGKATSK